MAAKVRIRVIARVQGMRSAIVRSTGRCKVKETPNSPRKTVRIFPKGLVELEEFYDLLLPAGPSAGFPGMRWSRRELRTAAAQMARSAAGNRRAR